jgi:hypothetical protein
MGGKVDRGQPTQVGRALSHLGVEHIAAYSPQARALAGITTMDAANAWLRDTYIPAHNARFAVKAEQEGRAFVAVPALDLTEILCVQEERVVGNDNCVSFLNRKLQIPQSPLRAHFVRATVKVHQYPDGGLAIFHGRLCLGRYDSDEVPLGEPPAGPFAEQHPHGLPPSAWRRARCTHAHGRSAPGNGPDSPTRKWPSKTPLLRRTNHQRAATSCVT